MYPPSDWRHSHQASTPIHTYNSKSSCPTDNSSKNCRCLSSYNWIGCIFRNKIIQIKWSFMENWILNLYLLIIWKSSHRNLNVHNRLSYRALIKWALELRPPRWHFHSFQINSVFFRNPSSLFFSLRITHQPRKQARVSFSI